MKALIRNDGETVTEDMGHSFIDWKTGAPLTDHDWFGGSYVLVDDYVRKDPADDFDPTPARRKVKGAVQAPPAQAPAADGATYGGTNPSAASQPADAPAQDPPADTIVIDGVIYTRAP